MIEEQQPAEPDEDLAPDADDDGDGMPLELADLVHEGDVVPDEVDGPSKVEDLEEIENPMTEAPDHE
jgi:hypothetical protein